MVNEMETEERDCECCDGKGYHLFSFECMDDLDEDCRECEEGKITVCSECNYPEDNCVCDIQTGDSKEMYIRKV